MVARADHGGLASQTLEMARHVGARRVLIVDLGPRGRGPCRPERFAEFADVTVIAGFPKVKHWEAFVDGLSAVYTAEVTYGPALPQVAAEAGVRLVVHANPELWVEAEYRGPTTVVVTPTDWCAERVPRSRVMPMPVNRAVLPFRERAEARVVWHPCAPAMLDRHGSLIVRAALEHVRAPIRLVVTGDDASLFANLERVGRVTVERRVGARENYWEGYDEADVLLLPRRYGGLSLPVQEALSSGMPVVMLATGPYVGRGGVVGVPIRGSERHWMKGGPYDVHDGDPAVLAAALDMLVADPAMVRALSREADAHAESLSWSRWQQPWVELLGGDW